MGANNTSIFDSVYSIKLAQIQALNGSTGKKYDSVYDEELEMLNLLKGGLGPKIDDNDISTAKVWSSYKTHAEIQAASAGDYLILTLGDTWTEEKKNALEALKTKYNNRLQNHLFYGSNFPGNGYITCSDFRESGAAIFLEYYMFPGSVEGGDFYATTINTSLNIGATIQTGGRDSVPSGMRLYSRSQLYTKTETDAKLGLKADSSTVYNKTWIDASVGEINANLGLKADTSTVYNKGQIDQIVEDIQSVLQEKAEEQSVAARLALKLDSSQYIYDEGIIAESEYYLNNRISEKADASSIYDKTYIDGSLNLKANANNVYTKAEVYTKTNVNSLIQDKVKSINIVEIYALTQAEYDALAVKDPSVMYVITDASI